MKREIKSHKGGRTAIIPSMRVTPGEKIIIDDARGDISYSDFLVEAAIKKLKHSSRQKSK